MQQGDGVADGRAERQGSGPSTLEHARRIILIQYEARIPSKWSSFVWPPSAVLLQIQGQLDHDLFQYSKYEATMRYRTTFLRELCARLDAAVQDECAALCLQGVDEIEYPEVDAALLERYVETMSSGSSGAGTIGATLGSAPETEYTTHCWPRVANSPTEVAAETDVDLLCDYAKVTIREEGSAISKGTTGLRTWEAGLRLACHLISEPSVITAPGTRILELGSGAGFVGTVCATQQLMSQQADLHTFLTDVPGQVVTRIRETLHVNGLDGATSVVEVKELDWLELSAERQQSRQRDDLPTLNFLADAKPTLILAADVVYDPDLIDPLVETIKTCLEAGTRPCRALVASTVRNPETYGAFEKSLDSFGLKAKVIEPQYPTLPLPAPEERSVELPSLPIFPSAHDPALDGRVELRCITLH